LYTANAIMSMLQNNLSGMRIIDAGAGDGMLSLAALKLGAHCVELVEKNRRSWTGLTEI